MDTVINENFGSTTTSEDGKRVMVLPNYDPVDPTVKFTKESQAIALVKKYKSNAAYWSPIAAPTYENMKFNSFIFYVKTIGGLSSEEAMDILADSNDPDIRFLRTLLMTPGVLIHRDSVEVSAGLDILMAKTSLDENGKTAILDNWPTA